MRKTNKSDLAKKLESVCAEVPILPKISNHDRTDYVIDGMALMQALNKSFFKTFDDLSQQVLEQDLYDCLVRKTWASMSLQSSLIAMNKEDFIKQMERQRRGARETKPTCQITGARDVPNYRLFLKGSASKAALAAFVCESIAASAPAHLKQNKIIILAGGFTSGETVKSITKSWVARVPHLFSTQEEADTRMILHATDRVRNQIRVIVRCDDTDVLVLLLYYFGKGLLPKEVYMHAGHSGRLSLEKDTSQFTQSFKSLVTE